MENFCGIPKNHENHESLAQQIFPCLQYFSNYKVNYDH